MYVFVKIGLPSFSGSSPFVPCNCDCLLGSSRKLPGQPRARQSALVSTVRLEAGLAGAEAREMEAQRQWPRSRAGRSNAGVPGLPHRVLSNPVTLVTPDSFHPAHGLESSPLRPPGVRLALGTSPFPPRQKESVAPGIYGPGSLPPGLLWVATPLISSGGIRTPCPY